MDTAIFIVIISLLIYFLPAIIASNQKKENAGAVLALNFLLGWTLIGWVIALVWAMTKDKQPIVTTAATAPSTADELTKLAELKEKGVLSDEEFEVKKKEFLSK